MSSNDFAEVVDEFVDDLDPDNIEDEANRLGVTVDKLLSAIVTETKARISGSV